MHLLSTLLLGISTNLDNLLIGVSFGFLKKRIAMKANWKDTKHNRRYNYNSDRSVFTDTIKGI